MATKCTVMLAAGWLVAMSAFAGHAADGSTSDRQPLTAATVKTVQSQPTPQTGSAVPSKKAPHIGVREVINALETPFKNRQIADYTAKFSQESRIASLERLQQASGELRVRFDYRSGSRETPAVMFHWQYEQPARQELVSNGKTLWVYLPENNQVIQSDVEMAAAARENDPMSFLTGLGNLSRDFEISFAEPRQDEAGNYLLDLRPRRATALLNRMEIAVVRPAVEADTANRSGLIFPILSTTVHDANGNSTTIMFSDVRVNRGLSAGQFNFVIPPGVEVVRPTGKGFGF